jgi:hypothetical protein
MRQEPVDEQRHQSERVAKQKRFRKGGRGRGERDFVLTDLAVDRLVGELFGDLRKLVRRQEQQRVLREQGHELRVGLEAVFDALDETVARSQSLGKQVGEVLDLVGAFALVGFEQDDQVVDRTELVERLAKRVDLAVAARDEIQDVGFDPDARSEPRRRCEQDQRAQEHEPEAFTAEPLDAEENALLASDTGLAGRMVAHGIRIIPFPQGGVNTRVISWLAYRGGGAWMP